MSRVFLFLMNNLVVSSFLYVNLKHLVLQKVSLVESNSSLVEISEQSATICFLVSLKFLQNEKYSLSNCTPLQCFSKRAMDGKNIV